MRILAFDSALGPLSVALVEDDVVLARRALSNPDRAAEALLPLIAECLEEAGLRAGDLDRLAVTLGPGRFTSLRVGLAAAHGLALAARLPVVGIGSFEALAASVGPGEAPLVAGIDAGRGEVAIQCFDGQGARLGDVLIGSLDALAGALPDPPWRLAGTGLSALGPVLIGHPDARAIAQLARTREPDPDLQPIYLRPPAVTLP